MKHLRVTVQGKVYEVTVETLAETEASLGAELAPLPAAIATSVESAPMTAISTGGPGEVASPLAGKVVGIQVTAGQKVKQGDQLIVLEAMKMNTYIHAPQDGTVAEILTNIGDAVAEGQTLLRIS